MAWGPHVAIACITLTTRCLRKRYCVVTEWMGTLRGGCGRFHAATRHTYVLIGLLQDYYIWWIRDSFVVMSASACSGQKLHP